MTIFDDIAAARKAILEQYEYKPPMVTVHSPACPAVKHNDKFRCTCGGSMFPTPTR